MTGGLDPVSIRVAQEGGIVVCMIGRTQAGRTIANAAVRDTSGMKGIDRRPVGGTEAPVPARRFERCGGCIGVSANRQVRVPIVPGVAAPAVADRIQLAPDASNAKRRHRCIPKGGGNREVPHGDGDMIDHDFDFPRRVITASRFAPDGVRAPAIRISVVSLM